MRHLYALMMLCFITGSLFGQACPPLTKDTLWKSLVGNVRGASVRSQAAAKLGTETVVRLRCGNTRTSRSGALYVVDGKIMEDAHDINPDSIESYTLLQEPAAMALFGIEGANGVIVMTTKLKTKTLKEVIVVGNGGCRTRCRLRCCSIKSVSDCTINVQKVRRDTVREQQALTVYPNPAPRGASVSISVKNMNSNMLLQVIDAQGRVIHSARTNTAKNNIYYLPVNPNWSAGMHFIRILDASGKVAAQSKLMVQ